MSKTSFPHLKPSVQQEALDNLMLDGDNIVSAARRAIMRHDYSAVLTIFPILRHLKMNKSEFDTTLQVGLLSASCAPQLQRDGGLILCQYTWRLSVGHGGKHQEQAADTHHLHGNDRSQSSGGVRRQHQGESQSRRPGQRPPTFFAPWTDLMPDNIFRDRHESCGIFKI